MTIPTMPRRAWEEDTLVTADEIAVRWKVHGDTVYRLPPQRVPYVRLGPGRRRSRWADVLAYETSNTVGAG